LRRRRTSPEREVEARSGRPVSEIKPYEGFGDVDHTIEELMSF
jgi:hypothetical protein